MVVCDRMLRQARVMPANAGIHRRGRGVHSRFRGNDGFGARAPVGKARVTALIALSLLSAVRVHAESPHHASSNATTSTAPAGVVRPAPGGGEMIILGPDSRYEIRARSRKEGVPEIGCAREDTAHQKAAK